MDHQSQLVEQVFFLAKDFKSGKQEFYEINQQDIFKVAPYIRNANASNIVLDSLYAVVDKIIDKLSNPPGQTSSTPNIKEEPSNDNECSITSVPPPHAAHEPNGMLSMPPGLPRPFADLDRDFLQRGPHPYDSIHMQNQQYQNDQLNNNNQQGFLPKPMFDSEGLNKGYPVNSMNNHPGYFDKNYYNNMPMIPPNTFSASIGLNTYNNSPFGNPVSIGNNYGGSSMIQPPSNTNEKTNAPPPNMSGADKIDESDHEDDDSEDDSNDEDETNRRNFEGSVPLEGSTSYPNKGYAIDPKLIPGLGPTNWLQHDSVSRPSKNPNTIDTWKKFDTLNSSVTSVFDPKSSNNEFLKEPPPVCTSLTRVDTLDSLNQFLHVNSSQKHEPSTLKDSKPTDAQENTMEVPTSLKTEATIDSKSNGMHPFLDMPHFLDVPEKLMDIPTTLKTEPLLDTGKSVPTKKGRKPSVKKENKGTEENKKIRSFSCPKCGRSYEWNYNLNRHIKYECGKDNAFICTQCQRKFPHKQNCVYHLKRKHKIIYETLDQYMNAGLVVQSYGVSNTSDTNPNSFEGGPQS